MLSLMKRVDVKNRDCLEEAFTSWWNGSEDNSRFFFSKKHENEGFENVDTLIVVFSSLGSGLVRPEWGGTLKQLGVFDAKSRYKVLHVLDPAYSWFNQDPSCKWKGGEYYENEIKKRIYDTSVERVIFLGDSMGGAGALRFCHLANYTLSFTPQIDLVGYAAVKRSDFKLSTKKEFKERIALNVKNTNSNNYVEIHYGEHCTEDVRQIKILRDDVNYSPNVKIVTHDFDDHTLSIHLKKKNELEPLISKFFKCAIGDFSEEEKLEELRKSKPLLPVGTCMGVYYDCYHLGEVIEVDEKLRKILVRYVPNNDEYWEDYPSNNPIVERREGDFRVVSREEFEGRVVLRRGDEETRERLFFEREEEGEGEKEEIEGRTMRML